MRKLWSIAVVLSALCTSSADARSLQKGMKGHDVKQWQEFLRKQGFDPGPVNGVFDAKTYRATVAFQRKYGLQGDGILEAKTIAMAQRLGYSSSPPKVTKPQPGNPIGTWDVTWKDPYATYRFSWEVRPDGEGKWRVKHKLIDTDHSFNRRHIGTEWDDILLTAAGPGKFKMERTGGDQNPANPGYFKQTAEGTYDATSFTLTGQHDGSSLDHPIHLKGTRK